MWQYISDLFSSLLVRLKNRKDTSDSHLLLTILLLEVGHGHPMPVPDMLPLLNEPHPNVKTTELACWGLVLGIYYPEMGI